MRLASVLMCLASTLTAADAITLRLDPAMLERQGHFGYTPEEVRTRFSAPMVIPLDRSGLDRSVLRAPPAPGIHPRVLFNPEDLPGIRDRLRTTRTGQVLMEGIRAHLQKQLGDQGPQRALYDALAAAGDAGDLQAIPRKEVLTAGLITVYEAFRCLIDEDQAGSAKAAAAVAALARLTVETIDENVAKAKNPQDRTDFRVVAKNPSYQGTLGLMYDFLHGAMTPAQREVTRRAIVRSTAGMTYIGCETLRAGNTNLSNWIPWSSRMLLLCAAIEGEDGYDPQSYARASEAMTAFIGRIFDTGEAYEGWGKNFLFMEHLVVMAKHGQDVLAARNLRQVFRSYYLHAMNPWGRGFTFYDSQGGSDQYIERTCDAVLYRRLFPEDRLAEFVYRNHLKDDPANVLPGRRVNTSHPFAVTDVLCSAIFASDWRMETSWAEAQAEAAQGQPLSLFSEDTNNLITRSAWTPDALWLYYLNRAVPGGHRYSDRSHFSVSALGRTWGIYHRLRQVREQYRPENRSVVLAGDEGPSIAPGRCVRYQDQPLATVIATDLRTCWDYVSSHVDPKVDKSLGTLPHLPFSPNDFRLNRSPLPWMDLPFGEMPDWLTSRKPGSTDQPQGNYAWVRRPAVAFAYRTALLVRGTHPYAVIVDDLRRSGEAMTYTWGMTLPEDVVLTSTRHENGMTDALLGEAKPADKARHLLVRMVDQADPVGEGAAALVTVVQPNPPQKDRQIPKLVFQAQGIEPRFKALLIPQYAGDEVPSTTWSTDRTRLTIAWKDQVDELRFQPASDGRTRVGVARKGVVIVPPDAGDGR